MQGLHLALQLGLRLKSTAEGTQPITSVYSGTVLTKEESFKQCGTIQDNVDYLGNDLKSTLTASAEDCCNHCNQRSACNAYTWSKPNGGTYYMKNQAFAKPVQNSPQVDGSAFLRSGTSYKCTPLQANTDCTGGDVDSVPSSKAVDCCGICRSTSGCYTFTWTDYNGGTCWLKSPSSQETPATGVTSEKTSS